MFYWCIASLNLKTLTASAIDGKLPATLRLAEDSLASMAWMKSIFVALTNDLGLEQLSCGTQQLVDRNLWELLEITNLIKFIYIISQFALGPRI